MPDFANSSLGDLLNNIVCAGKNGAGDFETEGLCALLVDNELVLCRCLNRERFPTWNRAHHQPETGQCPPTSTLQPVYLYGVFAGILHDVFRMCFYAVAKGDMIN